MEKLNDAGKIVSALLVGAAIGGLLGILFAPDKGSETRKRLSAKSDDLTDVLKGKFNRFLEDAEKDAETVKNKSNEFIETVKDKSLEFTENGKIKAEKYI